MTALRQFLSRREAEISEQLKLLERELAEIRATWAALQAEGGAAPRQATMTIKDMVRTVLGSRPDGLTAGEILKEIEARFDLVIERTSLSPQLSRLGVAREVTLVDGRWYAAQFHLSDFMTVQHDGSKKPSAGGASAND